MAKPRRTPSLSPAGARPSPSRVPMVRRRRHSPAANRLAIAATISAALHAMAIAALIITFPNKTPPEAASPTGVQVVFEPGSQKATGGRIKTPFTQKAREAAPRGQRSPTPVHQAEAQPRPNTSPHPATSKPPEPPRLPHPPLPPHPKPVPTPPKPALPRAAAPTPRLVPAKPPAPRPPAPKPTPPLPLVHLPPPPPKAPSLPKAPPAPPAAPPAAITETSPAEVNLNLPPMPEFAPIQLPPPPPLPPAPPSPRHAGGASGHGRSNAFRHALSMNGMSYTGGGGTGGQSRGLNLALPSSSTPASGSDVSIKGNPGKDWGAELQQWVDQRAEYPEMAGEQGQQGSVTVRFSVDRAGHVSHLEMVTPTGYVLLDQAWLGLFRDADLPPLGPDATSKSVTVTATMHYQIVR
ncbi:energy transducer TonB [Acidisoma sp. C75]